MAVTSRTVPAAAIGLALLAALPVVITRARGGVEFTAALQIAALLTGAGAGFVADDQAANVLAPSPTPLIARRGFRAVGVVGVLAAGLAVALVVARTGTSMPMPVGGPLAVLAAAAGISAALAWAGPPDGAMAPGLSGAMAAVLVLLTTSALAERWPRMPTLAATGFDRRWLVVAVAGGAVAFVRSRDPARRRVRVRP